ncbi:MAG TPA: energy transducer TonB [bacterium]|nr:energy transducer TonB [bacterium]
MHQSFVISLIAHLVLLLAIAVWPGRSIPIRVTSTLTIQQVDLTPEKPVEQPPKPVPPPPPPPPPKDDLEKVTMSRIKERLKELLNTPKPKPTPVPTRPKPKQTATPVEKKMTPTAGPTVDFRRFEEVVQAQTPFAFPTPIPGTETTEGNPPVVFEEGFNYGGYADRLMRRLANNWNPPAWQPSRERGMSTQVCFTIRSDGMIVQIYVERSSGWPELDESARRAVQKSSPVEPLPSGYGRASVKVHALFRPNPE